MSLKTDIQNALKGFVGNRCYPDTFPQSPATPVWPAIRHQVFGGDISADICGSGTETTDDVSVQIDVVSDTGIERDAIAEQVRTRFMTFVPPAVLQSRPRDEFDSETKTYRCSMDYVFYGSSA